MIDHPSSIMVFAAGFGTRMGALTKSLPKPLIQVAGRPLIDHTLDLAKSVNPDKIVANLHYLPDQLADHLAPKGILLSHEVDILETGGGLKAAQTLLGGGPVYTMNPDVIWQGPNPLNLLQDAWQPAKMDALLMCVPIAQTIGRKGEGDFDADASGRIRRGTKLVYGGVQILKTKMVNAIEEEKFSLNVVWTQIATNGRLYSVEYPGKWCDVGYPKGIKLAEELLKSNDV